MDILNHVQLHYAETEHELWKRADLPFILPINNEEPSRLGQHQTVYDIVKTGEFVATNGDATFPVSQDVLNEFKQVAGKYYYLYLLRRKSTLPDSCEVALFLNELELIDKLCQITVRTILETALAVSNRETHLYTDRQTIRITCEGLGGSQYRDSPTVQGLVLIRLPDDMDCRITTQAHAWRADINLDTGFEMKSKPMLLGVERMLGISNKRLKKHAEHISLEPYQKMSIAGIKGEMEAVEYREQSHWVAIKVGVIIVIVIIVIIWVLAYLYRKRIGFGIIESLMNDREQEKAIPPERERVEISYRPGPRRTSELIQGNHQEEIINAPLLPSIEIESRAIPSQDVIDATSGRNARNEPFSGRTRMGIMRNILNHYRLSDNNDIVLRDNSG